MNANDSLKKLLEGNKRFVEGKTIHPHQDKNRLKDTLNKQEPYAVVICCSDSRVVPIIMFDAGIGDIFVLRIAGNFVNQQGLGSIAYAVNNLNSKVVLVVGHQNCGAINAAMKGSAECGFINSLIDELKDSVKGIECQIEAEKNNIRDVVKKLENLDEKVFNNKISSGEVIIKGAYYSLDTGEVNLLD